MREREAALELGARERLGEFRCLASRSFSDDWLFFTPIGLFIAILGSWKLFSEPHPWWGRLASAAIALFGAAFAGLPLIHRFDRRPGSAIPRLYCFTEGVVIARTRTLTAYRWADLAIDRRKWTSGSGDSYDSGTSTTVRRAVDGSVLAEFNGNEPGRANEASLLSLHEAAVDDPGTRDRFSG